MRSKLFITIVGAGQYGRNLVAPKYKKMPYIELKSIISPTIRKQDLDKSALTNLPIYKSATEWKYNQALSSQDVFDLAVHCHILPKVVEELANIGAKKFIFPKPMAITKQQLNQLTKLKADFNLNIAIASQWHYSNLTKRLKQLVRKNRKKITKLECIFAQNYEPTRLKKYTPTTALLPHILEVLYSIGILDSESSFKLLESTNYKIILNSKTKDGIEIFITSDINSEKKERTIRIFLDNEVIEVDFLGMLINNKWIVYPSITYQNKKMEITEDNLEVMLKKIISMFSSDKKERNDFLTFTKYLPISNIQIKIEEKRSQNKKI